MPVNRNWKKYIGLAGILFLFPLAWVLLFGVFGKHRFDTPPYFSPQYPAGSPDSTSYVLPDFAFSDETGKIITRDSLSGKIWLAAFYDLKNPHLSKITERLLEVNFKFRSEPDIKIIVFSTDCEYDTRNLREDYIRQNIRYTATGKWHYLTGNQEAMQSFMRNGFLLNDVRNEGIFRLVDANGHIRGIYGNTEYHFGDAMEDIALLKKETDLRNYNERKAHKSGS